MVRREIEQLRNIGVKFECNVMAGPEITVDDMFARGFDAIFMGTGTALPRTLDIPGQELRNVLTAQYYLLMVQLVNSGMLDDKETMLKEGDRVAVIGAGNVAMDAARTAIRRGAKEVTIYFRRTEAEMTAFPSEIKAAEEEGVRIRYLSEPVKFLSREEMQQITGKALTDKEESGADVFGGSEGADIRKPVGGMLLPLLSGVWNKRKEKPTDEGEKQ